MNIVNSEVNVEDNDVNDVIIKSGWDWQDINVNLEDAKSDVKRDEGDRGIDIDRVTFQLGIHNIRRWETFDMQTETSVSLQILSETIAEQ